MAVLSIVNMNILTIGPQDFGGLFGKNDFSLFSQILPLFS